MSALRQVKEFSFITARRWKSASRRREDAVARRGGRRSPRRCRD